MKKVSNPWREAIEDEYLSRSAVTAVVSNPWREAIEESLVSSWKKRGVSFQSLEGGY